MDHEYKNIETFTIPNMVIFPSQTTYVESSGSHKGGENLLNSSYSTFE